MARVSLPMWPMGAEQGSWRLVVLGSEDVPALVEIERRCFPGDPWPAQAFAEEIGNPVSHLHGLVDMTHDAPRLLAGFCLFWHVGDEVEVLNVGVDPQWRRRGLGKVLVDHMVDCARALGVTRLVLDVRPSNVAARTLYQHGGFEEIGRRKRYYANGEDGIVMCRWLVQP